MMYFKALDEVEQAVVAAFARARRDELMSQKSMRFANSASAEAWEQSLCELIAADSKRVQSIVDLWIPFPPSATTAHNRYQAHAD